MTFTLICAVQPSFRLDNAPDDDFGHHVHTKAQAYDLMAYVLVYQINPLIKIYVNDVDT